MDLNSKLEEIKNDVTANNVMLYMKGSKDMPMCGFSAQVVNILNILDANYATRDVLQDPLLRQAIKVYGNWPTLPQLYVNGELVGGCDVVTELYNDGELKEMLPQAG